MVSSPCPSRIFGATNSPVSPYRYDRVTMRLAGEGCQDIEGHRGPSVVEDRVSEKGGGVATSPANPRRLSSRCTYRLAVLALLSLLLGMLMWQQEAQLAGNKKIAKELKELQAKLSQQDARTANDRKMAAKLRSQVSVVNAIAVATQAHALSWSTACGLSESSLRLNCATQHGNAAGNLVQLWGERHSGTDAAEYLLKTNFDPNGTPFRFGFKHMFMDNNSDAARKQWAQSLASASQKGVPSLVLTREPLQWLLSMVKIPYHAYHFEDWSTQPQARVAAETAEAALAAAAAARLARDKGSSQKTDDTVTSAAAQAGSHAEAQTVTAGSGSRAEAGEASRTAYLTDTIMHEWVSLEKPERFASMMAMRSAKLEVLLQSLAKATALFVRFEDMIEDSVSIVCRVARVLRLCPRHPYVTPLDRVVLNDFRPQDYARSPVSPVEGISFTQPQMRSAERCVARAFPAELRDWVHVRLNWSAEKLVGYDDASWRGKSDADLGPC